jgi:hypothetical protein
MVAPVRQVFGPKIQSDLLKWEVDRLFTRDSGVLKASNIVDVGSPLGAIVSATVASAAKAGGNTGTGTLVVDATTPALSRAEAGVYTVRCVTAIASGGEFEVVDPIGVSLGPVNAVTGGGATFADRVKFVITANAGTNFVVGDGFDITVSAVTGKLVNLVPGAADGSGRLVGFALGARDPGGADSAIQYLARGPAVVADSGIVWPTGITTAQKATALADAARIGIITRVGL